MLTNPPIDGMAGQPCIIGAGAFHTEGVDVAEGRRPVQHLPVALQAGGLLAYPPLVSESFSVACLVSWLPSGRLGSPLLPSAA